MKKIALFGGSFNPPHEGHFEAAKFLHETLKVDEVWFLFSMNWQKDPSKYASCEHRMEMGRIMMKHYPGMPFIMSDIQEELGTHITRDVLAQLQARHPADRFIWVMGADNLLTLNTWEHYEEIMEKFPVAVMAREPYTQDALKSFAALTYAHLKTDKPEDLGNSSNGWALLNNPPSDLSSSTLLERLHAGEQAFSPTFQDVATYIRGYGLYGLGGQQPVPDFLPKTP